MGAVPAFFGVVGVEHPQSRPCINHYLVLVDVVTTHFEFLVLVGIGGEGVGYPHLAFQYRVRTGGGVGTSEVGHNDESYSQRVALVARSVLGKTLVEYFLVVELDWYFTEYPFAVIRVPDGIVGEFELHLLHRDCLGCHFVNGLQIPWCIQVDMNIQNAVAALGGTQFLSVPPFLGEGLSVQFDAFP